jgi:hypothetical protein
VSHIELIHQAVIDLPETLRRLKGNDGSNIAVQFINDEASHIPTPEVINTKNPVMTMLDHPYFNLRFWREEVFDCNTERGYRDWVAAMVEQSRDEREKAGYMVLAVDVLKDGTRVEKLAVPKSGCYAECTLCLNDVRVSETPSAIWAIVDTTELICPDCAEKNNLYGKDDESKGAA